MEPKQNSALEMPILMYLKFIILVKNLYILQGRGPQFNNTQDILVDGKATLCSDQTETIFKNLLRGLLIELFLTMIVKTTFEAVTNQ